MQKLFKKGLVRREMRSLATSLAAVALAVGTVSVASELQAATVNGFTGEYDVANWTMTNGPVPGSVDTSGAPGSIVLEEPDNEEAEQVSFVRFMIAAAADGVFSFAWNYEIVDACNSGVSALHGALSTVLFENPSCSPASLVAVTGGGSISSVGESGTFSVAVSAGDMIGWENYSDDSAFGPNSLTISNFSAPSMIPLPAALPLLLLGLGGLGFASRRRRAA